MQVTPQSYRLFFVPKATRHPLKLLMNIHIQPAVRLLSNLVNRQTIETNKLTGVKTFSSLAKVIIAKARTKTLIVRLTT